MMKHLMNTVDTAGQIDYDQVFNATANGVVVIDNNGIILKANKNAQQILGVKEHILVGSSIYLSSPLIGQVIKETFVNGQNIRGHLASDKDISVDLNTTIIWKKERILAVVLSFQETTVFEKIA